MQNTLGINHRKISGHRKHKSEEWKRNHSKLLKGRKLSEENKIKIGLANKGKKRPDLAERNRNTVWDLERRSKCFRWKGGITPQSHAARLTAEYKRWRHLVFERDGFTCQKCGQFGGDLFAHHVQSFSEYPELRVNLENGVTLCQKCHKEIHSL